MRYHFWYVLIHVGLELTGYQYFLFTNTGGTLAFGAALVVQAYAVFETPNSNINTVNQPNILGINLIDGGRLYASITS